jgi:hypothetical protein
MIRNHSIKIILILASSIQPKSENRATSCFQIVGNVPVMDTAPCHVNRFASRVSWRYQAPEIRPKATDAYHSQFCSRLDCVYQVWQYHLLLYDFIEHHGSSCHLKWASDQHAIYQHWSVSQVRFFRPLNPGKLGDLVKLAYLLCVAPFICWRGGDDCLQWSTSFRSYTARWSGSDSVT